MAVARSCPTDNMTILGLISTPFLGAIVLRTMTCAVGRSRALSEKKRQERSEIKRAPPPFPTHWP